MNQAFEGTNVELTTPSDILGIGTQGAASMGTEAGWDGEVTQERLDNFLNGRLSALEMQDISLEDI